MNGKVAKLLLAAGMAMVIFSGCKREPSAANIMKEAAKNTSKAESFSGNMAADLGMEMKESGVSIELDMSMDMDIEAVKETGACHMKGSVKAGLADVEMDMELYNVPGEEESEYITYTKIGNIWTKKKNDAGEENSIAELLNLESLIEGGGKLELEKEVEKEDDREVYIITTSVGSSSFRGMGDFMDGVLGGVGEGLKVADAEIHVIFRIYKDTMLPASVSVALSGKEGEGLVIPDGDGNEVVLNNLSLLLHFEEFNHVDKIEVPEDALVAQPDSMNIMGD